MLHNTGSFTVHSNIIVAFYNPPNVLLPELTETGSRSGCCRVVLWCSVIAPSCLGWGYFWLPPCLNPVVILRWIIHASSVLSSTTPSCLSHLLPLSPGLLSPSFLPFLTFLLLHVPILSYWAPSFNTTSLALLYICVIIIVPVRFQPSSACSQAADLH